MGRKWLVWERLGALAGLAFVALLLVGRSVGGAIETRTDPSQPGSQIAAVLIEHSGDVLRGIYPSLVAVFFLLWFVAYLRHRLGDAEGEGGWLASVAYGGGVVSAALMLVAIALELASTVVAQHGGDAAAAKTLFSIGWEYYGVLGPPMGALAGATAIVGLRFRILPAWLWIPGLVVGVFAGFGGFYGGFPVLLVSIWLVPLSIVLALRPAREEGSPERTDPAAGTPVGA